ncbi:DUF397 domain-containing protein [Crossiella sp. CA-258035]|uniref:DUF397 domain-containing protein n=1 Tax=Crossiella sp. CA-258035 TaxID=2981138 RepID=UPI0024BBEC00|nr:DUF397 domain-containing protein [Crossiella sp. CA-258035]WHT21035.1 DUF397 domain-containing protein [Crossiella sp. CA-258035]
MSTDLRQFNYRKSSYSGGNGGECVEVALPGHLAAVRDSKNLEGPILAFTPGAWAVFQETLRAGSFDLT